MTVQCQFCQQLIWSSVVVADDASEAQLAYCYRQLSLLVSVHMSEYHSTETPEIGAAMAMAGAAIAMRFVGSSDPRVDSLRIEAADRLRAALEPRPHEALVSLASASASPGV